MLIHSAAGTYHLYVESPMLIWNVDSQCCRDISLICRISYAPGPRIGHCVTNLVQLMVLMPRMQLKTKLVSIFVKPITGMSVLLACLFTHSRRHHLPLAAHQQIIPVANRQPACHCPLSRVTARRLCRTTPTAARSTPATASATPGGFAAATSPSVVLS